MCFAVRSEKEKRLLVNNIKMQPSSSSPSAAAAVEALSRPSATKQQTTISSIILLLALLAIIFTLISTQSCDIVRQVLLQKEMLPQHNIPAASTSAVQQQQQRRQLYTVEESYGFVWRKDDTGTSCGAHAAFYEYRLPRAFLIKSQHKEELTVEEAEELQFKSGLRKRIKRENRNSSRNLFLDEPNRDKSMDGLFKRSSRKIIIGLAGGSFSFLGLAYIVYVVVFCSRSTELDNSNDPNSSSKHKLLRNSHYARNKIKTLLLTSPWCGWLRKNSILLVLGVTIICMIITVRQLSSSTLTILRDDTFCPKTPRCASSLMTGTPSSLLEVDACMEGCVLGIGGKLIMIATVLWMLILIATVAITVITTLAISSSSNATTLSRRRWWRTYCLQFAIQQAQQQQLHHHK